MGRGKREKRDNVRLLPPVTAAKTMSASMVNANPSAKPPAVVKKKDVNPSAKAPAGRWKKSEIPPSDEESEDDSDFGRAQAKEPLTSFSFSASPLKFVKYFNSDMYAFP